MDASADERDQPEVVADPRPEEPEDFNLIDGNYVDGEEEDDVLGSLPQLQPIPSTLSTQNAEYALTIPMSVSSMSFSISPSMSSTMSFSAYTSQYPIDPRQDSSRHTSAFDSILADDASDAGVEDYSAYLSLYSTYTDYTGYTANTNATGFSTNSTSSMVSTQLVPSTASCGPLACVPFETDADEEEQEEEEDKREEDEIEEEEEAESMACVPFDEAAVQEEDGQSEEQDEADKVAVGCFSDMSWLHCSLFTTASGEQVDEKTTNKNAIVVRNPNKLFIPAVLSTQRQIGREDLLRLAIATILNLVAEHSATVRASTAAPVGPTTSASLARKACSDVVVYQHSTTPVPHIPAAPTTSKPTLTPPLPIALTIETPQDSQRSELSAPAPKPSDATSSPPPPEATPVAPTSIYSEASVGADATELPTNAEIKADSRETAASGTPSMTSMLGRASILTSALFNSSDLATGVMLELEANGLFLNAAEKFSAMDEEAQMHFINRNTHLLLGPSQPLSATRSSREENGKEGEAPDDEEEAPKESESPKLSIGTPQIPGVGSSSDKDEAFFHALLQLVFSSISNALEEVSTYFNNSCSASDESREELLASTAPKAVAKIIETDIMEQLETLPATDAVPPVENMVVPEEGVEFSVEQYQALRRSKSLFDTGISFNFSKYLQAVKKAKAHLATTTTTVSAPSLDIPEPKNIPPPEKNQQPGEISNKPKCRVIKSRVVPLNAKESGFEEDYFNNAAAKNTQDGAEPSSLLEMLPSLESPSLLHFLNIFPSVAPAPNTIGTGDGESCNTEVDKSKSSVLEKKKIMTSANEQKTQPEKTLAKNDAIASPMIKPAFKVEISVNEKKAAEVHQAEDICQRIVKEHMKKKKKIEKAKKKAIQEHLNKSRSDKASITSPSPPKSNMVKKLPSANQRRAKPGAQTRAKPKTPKNYKVTSGLKKSRKPLKKATRREKVNGKVSAGDSLKGVYKE